MKDFSGVALTSLIKGLISDLLNRFDENVPDANHLSSLGIKYPKYRDHPLHTGHLWLESKKVDDGAEGFWRIHDDLYDFNKFVEQHPGGSDWLKLTKGTDITEAFETHHLSTIPKNMLSNHFVRKAKTPRNSPFTFEETGFYQVLKKEVVKTLPTIPKRSADMSKHFTDLLFISYVTLAVLSVYFRSFLLGTMAGLVLALTAIASHNFFHQKDNFRMYYFDFTMMQSREWRISHALSHHLYTNTINDLEISYVEPFLQYLPTRKHFIFRYISWLYSPVVWGVSSFAFLIRGLAQKYQLGEKITWELILPFTIPAFAYFVTGESPIFCATMFVWIAIISGIYFGAVGVNAAHHHPEVFHDGDTTRSEKVDWGIYELDACADRKEFVKSHFLTLTSFGDHTLHHLFPTLDHGYLPHLYPVFLETCKRFGVEWKLTTQIDAIKGQFQQLANTKPNREIPGRTKFGINVLSK